MQKSSISKPILFTKSAEKENPDSFGHNKQINENVRLKRKIIVTRYRFISNPENVPEGGLATRL